jgi:hypothetical protein
MLKNNRMLKKAICSLNIESMREMRQGYVTAILGWRLDAVIMAIVLAATAWLAPVFGISSAAQAACVAGSGGCPIRLQFRTGSDRITVSGQLTPKRSRYSYVFMARAGQKLTWTFNGPTVRTLIRYPTGESDGPGLPDVIPLPRTGTYTFTVSSNTMAEGIFGQFQLTFQIH